MALQIHQLEEIAMLISAPPNAPETADPGALSPTVMTAALAFVPIIAAAATANVVLNIYLRIFDSRCVPIADERPQLDRMYP